MDVLSRDRKIAPQIVGLIQFFISLVKQLIESKSNGIDKILDKVPKISADIIAPSLTKIFKLSLRTSIFVGDWELVRVQPMYKSDDRSKCENYRPISVLPVVSKFFNEKKISKLVASC